MAAIDPPPEDILIAAGRLLRLKAKAVTDTIVSALLSVLDLYRGDPDKVNALLEKIASQNSSIPEAVMKCHACGYQEYCDSYQVGDWYV